MATPTNPKPLLNDRGLPPDYAFKPQFEISPREALARLREGTLLLVDCRTQPERDLVHVPGSQFLPLDDIERRHDEIEPGPGQQVAVICHHGVRSMRAALALRQVGHPTALSVAGGIDLWSLAADPSLPRYERSGGVCRILM